MVGLLLVSHSSQAAKKIDFSGYQGTYKAQVVINYGPTLIQQPDIHLEVSVPESGKQAKFRIVGFADASGTGSVSLLGNFTLKAPNKVVADNAMLAFFIRLPSTSVFRGKADRLSFPLTATLQGLGTFSMNYTFRLHGKKLTIFGTGTSANGPVTVQYIARRVSTTVSQ